MTGDEVRDTGFLRPRGNFARGYDAAEVDELLRLIAAELDAGRQVGPMIDKAEFRSRMGTQAYETAAVDWFLEMLRCLEDHSEPARTSDPWRDLAVGNYFTRGGPGDPPGRSAAAQPGRRKDRAQDRECLALECADACREFGQQPGAQLRWPWLARYRSLPGPGPLGCEITVHPGQQLSTELVLALVISAPGTTRTSRVRAAGADLAGKVAARYPRRLTSRL